MMYISGCDNTTKDLRPIRFGLMYGEPTLLDFEARCLENLLALDNVQLAVVIMDGDPGPGLAADKLKPFRSDHFLFRLYMGFVAKCNTFSQGRVPACLYEAPLINCRTIAAENSFTTYNNDDVEAIRAHNLDFILRFGFGRVHDEILNAARFGVWSFRYGDQVKERGYPPAFWEIYTVCSFTSAVLERVAGQDTGVTLKKGFIKTIDYSYAKNLDAICKQSARWPSQVCADIRNGVADYLHASPTRSGTPVYGIPGNADMVRFLLKLLCNGITRAYRGLFRHEHWNLGVVDAPIHSFLSSDFKPAMRRLHPPKRGTFLADPFGVLKEGKLTVLCEKFTYCCSRATISSLKLDGETYGSRSAPDFGMPLEAAYPYLLKHSGETYCVLTVQTIGEIRLYKALQFPQKWVKVSTLIRGASYYSDGTLFEYAGLWWLTFLQQEELALNCNLCVWYAPDLLGPWRPHANNPVKTDVRSARPAGTPFLHNGDLYRPAQDCSKSYGGRVVLNRVARLTPTEFREESVATVEPDAKSCFRYGLHTLSAVGPITLIDEKRYAFSVCGFMNSLSRYLRLFVKQVAQTSAFEVCGLSHTASGKGRGPGKRSSALPLTVTGHRLCQSFSLHNSSDESTAHRLSRLQLPRQRAPY